MTTSNRLCIGIISFVLFAALAWAPVIEAAPKDPDAKTTGKSDLNKDGVIDYEDLVLFSSWYLELDVRTIDWCAFVEATGLTEDIYGRPPSYYTKNFSELLSFTSDYFGCGDRSDMNGDNVVNARDLMVFSEHYTNEHFLQVDWCTFQQAMLDGAPVFGEPSDFFLAHYGDLVLLIQDRFKCTDDPEPPVNPLTLENSPKFLTRIAASRNLTGDYYVTDAKVGSVFIYDSNLVPSQELKGLAKPLGIAVNSFGHILVGNDKRNNVEVYDPDNGDLLGTFGESELEMPTTISVDSNDNIYVTDTRSNTVYVYDSSYQLVTNIGDRGNDVHQLRSPTDARLSADESELFVLDRLNQRVQVYNLAGDWLRSVIFEGTEGSGCNWFTGICDVPGAPPFTRLQAMDFDATGSLHVLDIFLTLVDTFDPQTEEFVSSYGSYGQSAGELKTPMDLLVETDRTLIVDGAKNTIEVVVP